MIRKLITETEEIESSYEDDEQEIYDQERVNRMIMFLDDLEEFSMGMLDHSEDEVFHALQGEFPDASEEEIAEAMASF